jgi:hypothetical protein
MLGQSEPPFRPCFMLVQPFPPCFPLLPQPYATCKGEEKRGTGRCMMCGRTPPPKRHAQMHEIDMSPCPIMMRSLVKPMCCAMIHPYASCAFALHIHGHFFFFLGSKSKKPKATVYDALLYDNQ